MLSAAAMCYGNGVDMRTFSYIIHRTPTQTSETKTRTTPQCFNQLQTRLIMKKSNWFSIERNEKTKSEFGICVVKERTRGHSYATIGKLGSRLGFFFCSFFLFVWLLGMAFSTVMCRCLVKILKEIEQMLRIN